MLLIQSQDWRKHVGKEGNLNYSSFDPESLLSPEMVNKAKESKTKKIHFGDITNAI